MTQFEYIAIAPSLILSFSLARAFSNLAPVFQAPQRYWIHDAWVVILLAQHVFIFWGYWLFHTNESWSLLEFILYLIHPVGLLVSASILIPAHPIDDYRSFFESIRTSYYAVWIVFTASDPFMSWVVLDLPLIHPVHLVTVAIVSAFAFGIAARRPSVDIALVVLISSAVVSQVAIDQALDQGIIGAFEN